MVEGLTYGEQAGEPGSKKVRSIYSERGEAAARRAGRCTNLLGKVNLIAFWMNP